MDELLSYIVKSLVNHPDDVQISEQSDGGQVNLLLTVNPEDMGLVIGKGGQTIKAIRKLLITKAIVDNVRVNLQLVEPEGSPSRHPEPSGEGSPDSESISTTGDESADSRTEVRTSQAPSPRSGGAGLNDKETETEDTEETNTPQESDPEQDSESK